MKVGYHVIFWMAMGFLMLITTGAYPGEPSADGGGSPPGLQDPGEKAPNTSTIPKTISPMLKPIPPAVQPQLEQIIKTAVEVLKNYPHKGTALQRF